MIDNSELVRWVTHRGKRIKIAGPESILVGLMQFFEPFYRFESNVGEIDFDVSMRLLLNGSISNRPCQTSSDTFLFPPESSSQNGRLEVYVRKNEEMEISIDRLAQKIEITGVHAIEVELQARFILRDQFLQVLEKLTGDVIVHAAGVQRSRAGVLFVGDKRAGKTTGLLRMMFDRHFDFLSSDRVKLTRQNNAAVSVFGVPARANIEVRAFESGDLLERLALEEDLGSPVYGKFRIEPRVLARAASVAVSPHAPATCIVFPQVVEQRVLTVSKMSQAELYENLLDNLLEDDADFLRKDWLGIFRASHIRSAEERLDELLEFAPVNAIRVRADYGAYVAWLSGGGLESWI